MFDFFARLFDPSGFVPRRVCGEWTPGLVWLHNVSDVMIWLAYLAIPLVLLVIAGRRKDAPFRPVYFLFIAFIVTCGFTHFLDVVMFYNPLYHLSGLMKGVTAVASWATVIALVPILPKALAMRSPEALQREIAERLKVEAELRALHAELEERVEVRTAELEEAVAALRAENEERERVERQLWASREQLRLVTDNAPVMLVHCDTERRYKFVNRAYAECFGLTSNEVVGRSVPEVMGEPAYDLLRANVDAVLTGQRVEFEVPSPYEGTEQRWLHYTYLPHHSDSGSLQGFLAVIVDVTERRKAEELLRSITDSVPALIAYVDLEGCYRLNNRAYEQWFGRSRSELAGRHMRDVLGGSAWAVIGPKFEAALAGQTIRFDALVPYQLGGMRWIDATYTPHLGLGGAIDGVVVLVNDISDKKEVETALRESEERFRSAFDFAPIGMALVALDGRWLRMNRSLCELVGYTEQELLATDLQTLTHPDDVDVDLGQTQDLLDSTARSYQVEKRYFHKQGQIVYTLLSVSLVQDGNGQPLYFVKQIKDITQRKVFEEQIKASLREKEVMLKEIHHRVKNNLQIVSTLLDLQSGHTTDPAAVEMFKESRGRVKSMALIHERLYRSQDMARVNLGEYVRQLADDLHRTYRMSEGIRLELEVDIPPLAIDIAIPCGLLLNELISNCFKHAFADADEGCLRVALHWDGAANVLTVADDGAGFPAETDFRNTTSFGLQLVNTMVDQLDGEIVLTTDRRTTFTIRFPKPSSSPTGNFP